MTTPRPDDAARATVRPMLASDLPAARALWSRAEGVELAEGDSEEELRAYLTRNPGASQVAVAPDGSLIGAILAGDDGRRGFVYHLAVSPQARGQGLGRRLVAQSLAVLQARGVRRVLALVARDNPRGRAFWLAAGWEAMPFAEPIGIDLP